MQRDTRLGHYRILGDLGAGGMGQVYVAEDTRLKRRVALKVLPASLAGDPERRARFAREAEAVAALEHPGIVTLYSIEEADGVHFMTMQLVTGRTLDALVPAGGMDLDTFLDLSIQLASAVGAAHRRGVTHRDLKPANVMVSDEGRVTVLDFGLATVDRQHVPDREDGASGATRLTEAGRILGTVNYMSPEQAQGLPVDARSDVFSLAVVFHEMLLERRPFGGVNPSVVISAILKDEPPPVHEQRAGLPVQLSRILQRALRKEPDRRHPTAEALAADLEELHHELRRDESAPAPAPQERIAPVRRAAGVAVAGLLGLLIAGGWWWLRPDAASAPSSADRPPGPIESIVTLPASVLGGPDLGTLADTVPRVISRGLSSIDGLEIGLPPSAAEFESIGRDVSRLPAELRPSAYVYSSVTAAGGDRVAINVQLVEATTRRIIWSEDFQGVASQATELARLAAEGIRGALGDGSAGVSVAGLAVGSEAETLLRQGKFYAARYENLGHASDLDVARGGFEGALRADPRLALAAAEAAHLALLELEKRGGGMLAPADEWVERALTIDARTDAVWAVRADLEGFRPAGDRTSRIEHALRGTARAPREPRTHDALGRALAEEGYSSVLAMAAFRRAAELDWLYHAPRLREAGLLLQHGRTTEAEVLVDGVLRLEPTSPAALLVQARLLYRTGRPAEAEPVVARLAEMVEGGRIAQANLEPLQIARAQGDAQIRVDMGSEPANLATWRDALLLDAALELARWDEPDAAVELLVRLAELDALPSYDTVLLSPALAGLRGDPRLRVMITSSRARFVELLGLLDDADERGELPGYIAAELAALEPRLGDVR